MLAETFTCLPGGRYDGEFRSKWSCSLPKGILSGNDSLANFIRGPQTENPRIIKASVILFNFFKSEFPFFCDHRCSHSLKWDPWSPVYLYRTGVSSLQPLWLRIGHFGSRGRSTLSDQLVWRRLEAEITQVDLSAMYMKLWKDSRCYLGFRNTHLQFK